MSDQETTTEQRTEQQPDPDTVEGMLAKILADQAAMRAQIASQHPAAVAPAPTTVQSPEERIKARLEEVAKFSHYCPGCGKLYNYLRECTGDPALPHPPIDVVSTDELTSGDPARHTAAPPSAG